MKKHSTILRPLCGSRASTIRAAVQQPASLRSLLLAIAVRCRDAAICYFSRQMESIVSTTGVHNLWPIRQRTALLLIIISVSASQVHAQLVNLGEFAPGLGTLVGVGFDASTDLVWVYPDFAGELRGYTRTGDFVASVPRPGESANDADVEFATESFTLAGTLVPVGTLLFINGETGRADIYAVSTDTGVVVASLSTSFGVHHVVGGAYHPARDTFFLLADKLDSSTPSTIAEINPLTGDVINSFGTGSASYTVNFGDIEISAASGNILLVSSDESSVRELTPTGSVVQDMSLPAGVSSLSGIGRDDGRGEYFVSSTNGSVWRLGSTLDGDYNLDGSVDAADYVVWRKGAGVAPTEANYNLWRSNFGRSAGTGADTSGAASVSGAAPEPATVILLLAAANVGLILRQRAK